MSLTSSRRRAVSALTTLLSASVIVAGCSSNGGAPPTSPTAVASSTRGADASGATAGAPGASTDPIARTTFPAVAAPGTIEAGLVSLVRMGPLAVLTLTWAPHYQKDPVGGISLYTMFGNVTPSISLVDATNLKRYVVVEDSSGRALGADAVEFRVANNSSGTAAYTFAAPPAGARVSIYADARPLFTDIATTG